MDWPSIHPSIHRVMSMLANVLKIYRRKFCGTICYRSNNSTAVQAATAYILSAGVFTAGMRWAI